MMPMGDPWSEAVVCIDSHLIVYKVEKNVGLDLFYCPFLIFLIYI
jgi:hypothetical protein